MGTPSHMHTRMEPRPRTELRAGAKGTLLASQAKGAWRRHAPCEWHSCNVHRLAYRSLSLLAAEWEWQQWGRRSLPPKRRRKERDFVPIHSLLQHAAFGPEDIDRIVAAY